MQFDVGGKSRFLLRTCWAGLGRGVTMDLLSWFSYHGKRVCRVHGFDRSDKRNFGMSCDSEWFQSLRQSSVQAAY